MVTEFPCICTTVGTVPCARRGCRVVGTGQGTALPHARGTARPSTQAARVSPQSHRCRIPAPSCQRLPAHVSGIPGCPLTPRCPRQLRAGLP